MTTPATPWLTIEQAAERLQVSVRWIERAVESGDLVQYSRGRQRRYLAVDLDKLLQPSRIDLTHLADPAD